MFRIIDRDEWGAVYDDGFHDRALPAEEVWLHHSVTIAPDLLPPFTDDIAAIRTLERIGEQRFGGGISYTWPITPVGLVFEGHSPHRSGSHTLNRNDIASAICFVGNYDITEPTGEQIRAAAWTLVTAKRNGWIRRARLNGGHQQAPGQDPTGCPGRYALAAIPTINQLAADYEAGRIDLDAPPQNNENERMIDLSGFNGYALEVTSGPITQGENIPVGSAWLFDATNFTLDFFERDALKQAMKDSGTPHIGCTGERVLNLLNRVRAAEAAAQA